MTFDVAIVGAGLVGCALARALSVKGLRCALIDAAQPRFSGNSWDSRVYALSPATVSFLERLEVWPDVPRDRVQAVHAMRIFGDRDARLEFSAYDCAVDRLATIAESGKVHAALWRSLGQVSIRCPARPVSLTIDADA